MFGYYKPAFTCHHATATHYTSWSDVKFGEDTERNNRRLRRLTVAELIKAFCGTRWSTCFSIETFQWFLPSARPIHSTNHMPFLQTFSCTADYSINITYIFITSKHIHSRRVKQGQRHVKQSSSVKCVEACTEGLRYILILSFQLFLYSQTSLSPLISKLALSVSYYVISGVCIRYRTYR